MIRSRSRHRLKSEINVVPFIDVVLVLLIVFMVAAPMMQQAQIELPQVGKASNVPQQPVEVVVKANGELLWKDRASRSSEKTTSVAEIVQLATAMQASGARPVVISGEKTVQYDKVIGVMDALQRANVKQVGLLVQPAAK